jgi:N-acetylglucosaminyl-diphospho-decaprenol L-rhamnosyltransferase
VISDSGVLTPDVADHHITGNGDGPIGIVVVNYDSHAVIERNLGRTDLSDVDCQVVVVDNFVNPAEAASVAALARSHGWELVALNTNVGFGAAVNIGIARAAELGCQAFLMLNPDASADGPVIDALHAAVRADRRAMVTPTVVRPDGSMWFQGGRVGLAWGGLLGPRASAAAAGLAWITGACVAVHLDLWSELGGFDLDYFLYWEDVDLSYRCQLLGGRVLVREDLHIVHEVGGTQDNRSGKSAVYIFYNVRNRLLFAAKHLGRWHLIVWICQTPMDLLRVMTRGGRKELLALRRVLLPGFRGAGAGLNFVRADNRRRATALARRRWATSRPPAASAHASSAAVRTVMYRSSAKERRKP